MPDSNLAIRVEKLSKSYMISHVRQGARYRTVRDSLAHALKGYGCAAMDTLRGRQILKGDEIEEFWALRDVSFNVTRGEVIGVLGRNGAGKSTLLKVLSRITEPTKGRVCIRGRLASLLEVGTGFHPELTGRENIYLNGAVLGMTRAEIRRKFDEIVSFAEVERFLDTPVKRYSSGMYVRLAFSVAAHLEPEILVVDEVLAVGDLEFQKKCLGKMNDVAGEGRTILFVSHNLGALERICRRGVLLNHGRIEADGTIHECIDIYQKHHGPAYFTGVLCRENSQKRPAFIQKITLRDPHYQPTPHLRTWGRCVIDLEIFSSQYISDGSAVIYISSPDNRLISLISTKPDSGVAFSLRPGINKVRCEIPQLFLSAGTYSLGAGIAIPNIEWIENEARLFDFEVVAQDVFESGLPPTSDRYLIPMPHKWQVSTGSETTCHEPAYED